MTEFVENYLQDSVGFIYVINDAINVHKVSREFLDIKWEIRVTTVYNFIALPLV